LPRITDACNAAGQVARRTASVDGGIWRLLAGTVGAKL
jgi:hypothetical protein